MFLYAFCNPLSSLDYGIILIILKSTLSLCLDDRGSTLGNFYSSIKCWCCLWARHWLLFLICVKKTYDAFLCLNFLFVRFFWVFNTLNWIPLPLFGTNRCSSLIKLISAPLQPLSLFQILNSLDWEPLFRPYLTYLHDPCAKLLLFLLEPLLWLLVLSWALIIVKLFCNLIIFLWNNSCLRLGVVASLRHTILSIHRLYIQRGCCI